MAVQFIPSKKHIASLNEGLVENICRESKVSKKDMEHKVAQLVNRLPPMPQNIDRILGEAVEADNDRAGIVSIVKQDPGLCADLLHLANEPSFGKSRKIETIDEAFNYLGIQPLVQLIRFCYGQNAIRQQFAPLKHLNEYFAHSQDISRGCHALAEVSNMKSHDRKLYATAGLIHDIGRLVIHLASNRINAHLLGTTLEKIASIDHDEKRVLGLSHCEVGWQICNKWKFSPILQEAVLRHHSPLIENDFSFPGALVFVAHFVSFSDMSGDILSKMLPAELLAKMNLSIRDFLKARKTVQAEF